MIKTTKDIKVYGAVLLLVILSLMAAAFVTHDHHKDTSRILVGAYFLNAPLNKLEFEERAILEATNEEMITELLVNILYKGPNNKMLTKTIPDFVKLEKGELIENKQLLELRFTTDGSEMTWEEMLFFRSSIVWTMTELSAINDVIIYINGRVITNSKGEPLEAMNRENLIINRKISPFVSNVYRVVLYFANEEYTGLLPEERVIQVTRSSPDQNIERQLVAELIAGPSQPGHFATVAPEARLHDVSTDGDICYVNLSNDTMTKYLNANVDAKLTIYSIVNSLTELSGISKVQFLVDSKKPEIIRGGYDLSTPIERDESVILTP